MHPQPRAAGVRFMGSGLSLSQESKGTLAWWPWHGGSVDRSRATRLRRGNVAPAAAIEVLMPFRLANAVTVAVLLMFCNARGSINHNKNFENTLNSDGL
jgi:hypothetical protein